MTVFIPDHKIETFQKELNKLNKKLATYGSRVSVISKKHTFVEREYNEDIYYAGGEIDRTGIFPKVVVKGLQVVLSEPDILGKEGVEFLGTVTYKNNIPSIYSVKEDIFGLVNIDRVDACDHCNTIRDRVRYFYFREDNTIKKIGSTCVKEWTGFDLEAVFSAVQNFEYFIKEMSEIKGDQSTSAPIRNVISALAEVTNNFQSYWEKTVTKDKVKNILKDQEHRYTYRVSDEQINEIKTKWNIKPTNGFEFNIVSALMREEQLTPYVSFESLGVACWAIWKAMFAQLENNKSEKKNSDYIGNIGDKVVLNGMMKLLASFNTLYGYTYLYQIETEQGIAKWFASNECSDIPEEGRQVTLKGTVKEHKEYKGVKETIVTRCNL